MWIHVPSTFCPSAAESEDSILASDWRFLPLERFCTLNAKPTAARSWLRACKTKPWMRRLFGLILEPSTANRGVESFTASLRESLASPTASRESVLARTMRETYGPTLLGLLAKLNPNSCFSKTLEAQPDFFASTLGVNWLEWVSGLRRDCLRRQRLARRMRGSDCSCWPTVRSGDGDGCQSRNATMQRIQNGGDVMLSSMVVHNWQTPASDSFRTRSGERKDKAGLDRQAKDFWTTPQAHDVTERGSGQKPTAAAGNACLARDARQWPTLAAHDGRRPGSDETSTQGRNLKREVEAQNWLAQNWPTPRSSDANKETGNQERKGQLREASCRFFLPDPPTLTPGGSCLNGTGDTRPHSIPALLISSLRADGSIDYALLESIVERAGRPVRRRLNPIFVCWLMNFPKGWTRASISCAPSEMAWSRWRRDMRSFLYALLSRRENK